MLCISKQRPSIPIPGIPAIHEKNSNNRYLHEAILEYSEALTATLPPQLNVCMFTCTGSEANDLALRLARVYTGGKGVVVTDNAYHGNSFIISQISPLYERRDEQRNLLKAKFLRTVPAPATYRIPEDYDGESNLSEFYSNKVKEAVESLEASNIKPAMLILDSAFSSDGIIVPPEGYIKRAVDIFRAAGGLYIADEVQAGFWRSGKNMWGFQGP